jgi:hypothetical protein
MPGSVNFAGWTFSWSIPSLYGGGLAISKANFQGTRVLFRATQPFVLVPYHGGSPHFKDGLGTFSCGSGIQFTSMTPIAPNAPSWLIPPSGFASNDNAYDPILNPKGAVAYEQVPASLLEPAKAVVWTKQQAANYQYIQRWEFGADGAIEAKIGLGARLWTTNPPTEGHVHNFYFRMDFDIVTPGNNLVQKFVHAGYGAGQDQWISILNEGKDSTVPAEYTKWRVINKAPKANGQVRGYEISPGSDGSPDGKWSSGDLWVVRYKAGVEDGSDVTCDDSVLQNVYATPAETVDGQDVVIWHVLRTHHTPRENGEEDSVVPYEFDSFRILPRDFLDHTPKNLYSTTPSSPI